MSEAGTAGVPFARAVAEVALAHEPLSPSQVREGAPTVGAQTLRVGADGGWETGVWEITPGVSTDVEAEEVFVVLTGSATVEIAGGETLELAPGVVGGFPAGARTVWRVHETLRKVYTIAL